MGSSHLLREHLAGIQLADMCTERLDELADAVAAMLTRHRAELCGLLAGGTESVVAAGRTPSGARLVVKGTSRPSCAVAEAQLFASEVPSPELYDLDPDAGVLAMEHIDGTPLVATAPVDPTGELGRLRALVDHVRAARLDPGALDGFAATTATRRARYLAACERAGRDDLAGWAQHLVALDAAGAEWVPLDIHPKNILVDRNGEWRLIDPMPTRFTNRWCAAKWAVVRRPPGTLAGACLSDYLPLLHPDEVDLVVAAAVWEVGSQRDPARADALLGLVEATAPAAALR